MAKSAEFKQVRGAALQPAEAATESIFDEVLEAPSAVAEAAAPVEAEWLDLPEDRAKYPYDGREVLLTRDLETAERAQWVSTRRYDAKMMQWVPDGFWVEPHTRRRLYPLGAAPAAYRSAT